MTTPSPSTVGSTATRMSRRRPAAFAFREMRPSCGLRRSAMSSLASTLRRVVTPGASRFGIRWSSWRTPSTRKRTTSASSCGSKWMSLAPSSAAWRMIELTRRTSGASETPSSASRSSPSSVLVAEVELLLDEGGALPGLAGRCRRLSSSSISSAARRRSRACSAWRAAARRSPGRWSGRRWRCAGGRRRSGTGSPRRARGRAPGSTRRRASGRRPSRGRRRAGGALPRARGAVVVRRRRRRPRRAARAASSSELGVRPSSMIACASEPMPARERATASRSSGISPVVSSRSATSCAIGFARDPRAGRVLGLDARGVSSPSFAPARRSG